MSNNAKNFVNGLNYNKLELLVHKGPAVYSHAKIRLTNKFKNNLNKFNTHYALISSNLLTKPLLNTQTQSLANKRKELFAAKIQNLKNRRNLQALTSIKNSKKYLNTERRAALNSIQQIQKNFKSVSSTPYKLKTGFSKLKANAGQGISSLGSRFVGMFKRTTQPVASQNKTNNTQNNQTRQKKFNINSLPDLPKREIIKKVVLLELMRTKYGISYLLNHHKYNQILFYKEGKNIVTRLIPPRPKSVENLTNSEMKNKIYSAILSDNPNSGYEIPPNIRRHDLLTLYSLHVTPYKQYFNLKDLEKDYYDIYNSIILDTMKPLAHIPIWSLSANDQNNV
jgi:hypothetical protein